MEAIKPFYDPLLAECTQDAQQEWQQAAAELAEAQPNYAEAKETIQEALDAVNDTVEKLEQAQQDASWALAEIEPPRVDIPQALIDIQHLNRSSRRMTVLPQHREN
jgi:predicted  nucleic acid-binding Zn-ribbon protein